MKKLLLVLAIVLFTTSTVRAAESPSFVTLPDIEKSFIAETSAPKPKIGDTTSLKSKIDKSYKTALCNLEDRMKGKTFIPVHFAAQVVSISPNQDKKIKLKTLEVGCKGQKAYARVELLIPKTNENKGMVSFIESYFKKNEDDFLLLKKDTRDKHTKTCKTSDKIVTFIVNSAGNQIDVKCGIPKKETDADKKDRIDNIGDQGGYTAGNNGADGGQSEYDRNRAEADKYEAQNSLNAAGAQPTDHGQGGDAAANGGTAPNEQYGQYNPYGTASTQVPITVSPEGDEDGSLGDEIDEWGDDGWDDDEDFEDGGYYPQDNDGKASAPESQFTNNDELDYLEPQLYGGKVYLTQGQINEYLGDFGETDRGVIQKELDAYADFEYLFDEQDYNFEEEYIVGKYGGEWWLDFDPNQRFEQAAECIYVKIDACAYPNLTEDDYNLMKNLYAESNAKNWDLNFNTLPYEEGNDQCSWYSCWWYGTTGFITSLFGNNN